MDDTTPTPFAPQEANQTAIQAIPESEPPRCDCLVDPYHRWNCPLTPAWAQTIRALDCNPWTVLTHWTALKGTT